MQIYYSPKQPTKQITSRTNQKTRYQMSISQIEYLGSLTLQRQGLSILSSIYKSK